MSYFAMSDVKLDLISAWNSIPLWTFPWACFAFANILGKCNIRNYDRIPDAKPPPISSTYGAPGRGFVLITSKNSNPPHCFLFGKCFGPFLLCLPIVTCHRGHTNVKANTYTVCTTMRFDGLRTHFMSCKIDLSGSEYLSNTFATLAECHRTTCIDKRRKRHTSAEHTHNCTDTRRFVWNWKLSRIFAWQFWLLTMSSISVHSFFLAWTTCRTMIEAWHICWLSTLFYHWESIGN